METKTCKKCNLEFPLSSYYRRSESIDGLQEWCKTCRKIYPSEYYEMYPKKVLRIKNKLKLSNDESVWYFYNNCRAGKRYPKRELVKDIKIIVTPRRIVTCISCGSEMISYGAQLSDEKCGKNVRGLVCKKCRQKELDSFNERCISDLQIKSKRLAHKFKSELECCEKLGTCDILHAHHTALIDDSERLTSEFLIGLICGIDKVKKYNNLSEVS